MTRDINNIDNDIVNMKRQIKQRLVDDPDILETLNNPNLDIDSPDDFLDTNIFGFIRIPKTQDTARNFICVTIDDTEVDQYNEVIKTQSLQFTIICHIDDVKTKYGVDRHDLISAIIIDLFNWTNLFGLQFKLVYNKESTLNADYYCRTLRFEAQKVNRLNKARMDNRHDKLRS